jgi:hypothetical protein
VIGQFGGIAETLIIMFAITSTILQAKANPDQAPCQGDAAQICGTGMQSHLRNIVT